MRIHTLLYYNMHFLFVRYSIKSASVSVLIYNSQAQSIQTIREKKNAIVCVVCLLFRPFPLGPPPSIRPSSHFASVSGAPTKPLRSYGGSRGSMGPSYPYPPDQLYSIPGITICELLSFSANILCTTQNTIHIM